jgi:hypothetical protein
MTGESEHAAPTGVGAGKRREVATPSASDAVERPVLHSDGVVCA